MVNGLFANKGPQAMKAAGANTQQHYLEEVREKSHQGLAVLLFMGWLWSGYLGWKMVLRDSMWKAGKGGPAERSSKPPFLVAMSNGRRSCTDTWCCWEAELHPHLSEFPLSWTRSWWKSIFTLLLLQAWKKGNGDNTCERAPKEETSRAAPVKGRGRKSSPCPDQSRLLLQTMVVQKPCYYRIPGRGGRALRYFFPL